MDRLHRRRVIYANNAHPIRSVNINGHFSAPLALRQVEHPPIRWRLHWENLGNHGRLVLLHAINPAARHRRSLARKVTAARFLCWYCRARALNLSLCFPTYARDHSRRRGSRLRARQYARMRSRSSGERRDWSGHLCGIATIYAQSRPCQSFVRIYPAAHEQTQPRHGASELALEQTHPRTTTSATGQNARRPQKAGEGVAKKESP